MRWLQGPLDDIKEEIFNKRETVVNPNNTYECIGVISIEDLEEIFDKYTTGYDDDEDEF